MLEYQASLKNEIFKYGNMIFKYENFCCRYENFAGIEAQNYYHLVTIKLSRYEKIYN